MASKLQTRRREEHQRYKEDVKREGKSFFPYAIYHDTVMSLVTVAVIIGLSFVWYFTADDTPEGEGLEAGVLGPWYAEKADPGTISFVPRPDWFFYFLFYLLRIFKWPETVVLGTVGIPTICLVLLIALPFYDRSPERRPLRRPVAMVAAVLTIISMAVLTWKGATAQEALGTEIIASGEIDTWAEEQGFADNPVAVQGAELFAESGCLNCHVYLGVGNANLGAPDLSKVGATGRGVDYFKKYVSNPAGYGNNVMISYSYLGDENLTKLATFLDASRGGQQSEDGG
jgi:menaquinol-cytochrome c reductase cytochrome b/c subunit